MGIGTKADYDILDLFLNSKRKWDGPEQPCLTPGCGIPTRSKSGICGVCAALSRAEARATAGDPGDLPIFFKNKTYGRRGYVDHKK